MEIATAEPPAGTFRGSSGLFEATTVRLFQPAVAWASAGIQSAVPLRGAAKPHYAARNFTRFAILRLIEFSLRRAYPFSLILNFESFQRPCESFVK
jgi:hypothetical protein